MTLSYTIVGSDQGQTLTVVFSDGEVLPVPSSHANFKETLDYIVQPAPDETRVKELLDLVQTASNNLTGLSERVSVSGNTLFFDDEPIDNTLSNHIVKLIREGDENAWKPFVAFLEKLATNPSESSQQSLYSWIADRQLTIAENGDFIAYKGVTADGGSINRGTAYVDGVKHTGSIPNTDGAVISMPRSDVNSDTNIGCSTGLHAGTWKYASDFAQGKVLEVRINPRDVVSVPDDCAHQKLRVCRYTVVKSIEQEYTESTLYDESDGDFEVPCDVCRDTDCDGFDCQDEVYGSDYDPDDRDVTDYEPRHAN